MKNRQTKELILSEPPSVEQIAGDRNPWEYGGTWHDPQRQWLIHVEGLDAHAIQDIEPDDVEVPDEIVRRIIREHNGNANQPLSAQPDIEDEVTEAMREWQIEEAWRRNEQEVRQPVFVCTDDFEDWMQADLEGALRDFDPAIHSQITRDDQQKIILVGGRIGWYELDPSPDYYSKIELARFLGIAEDKL